jgi:hypothetical protein
MRQSTFGCVLRDEKFSELKDRLKKCQSTGRTESDFWPGLMNKRLTKFMAWLQADGACSAALYGVITGLLLKRNFPA